MEELNENDRVTVVVYAGAEGVALSPTPGNEQSEILSALQNLHAGGSTNGGAGIKLAYKIASKQFIKGGINRVILCTDGDFNVGVTTNEPLVKLVERKAKDSVFLSVCGFGQDNLNDSMLEEITNKGNGNYFFKSLAVPCFRNFQALWCDPSYHFRSIQRSPICSPRVHSFG